MKSQPNFSQDSHLCVWNYDGKLIHKWKIHQGACVWTVDYNANLKVLVRK